MESETEICRLCLKSLSDVDPQYLIDEHLEQEFYNVTQIELHHYASQSNKVCEFCFRSLQYVSFLRNQWVSSAQRFKTSVETAEVVFTSPIKIERVSSLKPNDYEEEYDNNEDYLDDLLVESSTRTVKGRKVRDEERANLAKKRVKCDLCPQTFVDNYKLKRHRARLHTPKSEAASDFVCCECGKTFASAANLKNHILYHRDPAYQCEYCSKTFYEAASLRNHINSNHLQNKAYKCTQCTSEYFKQHHLNRHVLRAHKNQRFICTVSECNKIFARKEKVRDHIRVKHRGIKPGVLDSLIREVRDDEFDEEGEFLNEGEEEEV